MASDTEMARRFYKVMITNTQHLLYSKREAVGKGERQRDLEPGAD